jgi:uncharacterized MAPEG superfamily protein
MDGEIHSQTKNLPFISVRTILPLAQFVNAKIASEEKSNASPKSTSSAREGKGQRAQWSTTEPVEPTGTLPTEITCPTMGATHPTNTAHQRAEKGDL